MTLHKNLWKKKIDLFPKLNNPSATEFLRKNRKMWKTSLTKPRPHPTLIHFSTTDDKQAQVHCLVYIYAYKVYHMSVCKYRWKSRACRYIGPSIHAQKKDIYSRGSSFTPSTSSFFPLLSFLFLPNFFIHPPSPSFSAGLSSICHFVARLELTSQQKYAHPPISAWFRGTRTARRFARI